jgi:hypothetical protein
VKDSPLKSHPPSPEIPDFDAGSLEDLQKRTADLLKRADAAIRRARELVVDSKEKRAELRGT